MTAYVQNLQALVQSGRSESFCRKLDLEARVVEWFAGVPEISRCRPFAMVEIETALGTQGRYLSPVLFKLGWQRRRKWAGRAQYNRYWVPPCALAAEPKSHPQERRTSRRATHSNMRNV